MQLNYPIKLTYKPASFRKLVDTSTRPERSYSLTWRVTANDRRQHCYQRIYAHTAWIFKNAAACSQEGALQLNCLQPIYLRCKKQTNNILQLFNTPPPKKKKNLKQTRGSSCSLRPADMSRVFLHSRPSPCFSYRRNLNYAGGLLA